MVALTTSCTTLLVKIGRDSGFSCRTLASTKTMLQAGKLLAWKGGCHIIEFICDNKKLHTTNTTCLLIYRCAKTRLRCPLPLTRAQPPAMLMDGCPYKSIIPDIILTGVFSLDGKLPPGGLGSYALLGGGMNSLRQRIHHADSINKHNNIMLSITSRINDLRYDPIRTRTRTTCNMVVSIVFYSFALILILIRSMLCLRSLPLSLPAWQRNIVTVEDYQDRM